MGTDTELRSYGDTYHWAVHGPTVASLYLQRQGFFRGFEAGVFAGDGAAGDIFQPGGAELSDQWGQAPRLSVSGNFGSCYAGLGNGLIRMKAKQIATPANNRMLDATVSHARSV